MSRNGEYGDKAKDLRLKFAHRDAQDIASALVNTQDGGLYAQVMPQFIHDGTANKDGIFDALAVMERNMGTGTSGDLAVIMFSGHGTMIDGQFHLVPYGADVSTPARLKSSTISAADFQSEITKLATHGRVLVLLDACRSATLIGRTVPGADLLRSVAAMLYFAIVASKAPPGRNGTTSRIGRVGYACACAAGDAAEDAAPAASCKNCRRGMFMVFPPHGPAARQILCEHSVERKGVVSILDIRTKP